MTTERIVSHYCQIKACRKTSLLEEPSIIVSLNGVGTVHPRLTIIEIINEKKRRYPEPDPSTYH